MKCARRDGDDVFLIGEVDAGFDEREEVGEGGGEAIGGFAELPVAELVGGGELGVAACGDERGDAFGFEEVEFAGAKGAEGELAGLGGSGAGVEGGLEDAFEERGVAGDLEFDGVVGGVAVGSGEEGGEDGEVGLAEAGGGEGAFFGGGGWVLEEGLSDVAGAGAGNADHAAP